jgi:hypothetical protein
MSFPGGNTLPNIGKRINWHVLTLVGGLVVAISFFANPGLIDEDTTPTTAAVVGNVSKPQAVSTAVPPLVIYFVETREQSERAYEVEGQAALDRAQSGIMDPGYTTLVIDTGSERGDDFMSEMLAAWTDLGAGIYLIDLTGQ